jgi:uncharacterized protein (TIGR03437 family)
MTSLRLAVFALVVGVATTASAQILDIEINNGVFYVYDTTDLSTFATSPAVVPPWSGGPSPRNFFSGVFIADIVSVNGQPARGVMVRRGTRVGLTTNQVPGQAIADTIRGFIDDGVWEIQTADGTAVGTFTTHGFIGGPAPPGAPAAAAGTNLAVTGGTGAFFGVGGQLTAAPVTGSPGTRVQASVREDPANRRINGGNRSRFLVQLLPAFRPEIVVAPGGRAVFHAADGRPVTTGHPATVGEALTLYARSLGPQLPSAAGAGSQIATGAVQVVIDGLAADVISAAADPQRPDVYRINFVVPDGVLSPISTLSVSSAWVSSTPVQFPTR